MITRDRFVALGALPPDSAEYQRERERIIRDGLPLAQRIAARFRDRGEPYEDLCQVARLALVLAVDRYDPEAGTEFVSFATPTIAGELKRYFRDNCWTVRAPRRLQELRIAARRCTIELTQELHHAPSAAQVAERLDTSVDEVREMAVAGNGYAARSIFEPAVGGADESLSLIDTLSEAEPGFEKVDNHQALKRELANLPERDRSILFYRFYGNMTQQQIADLLGISQMHVSRLISRSCTRLRHALLGTRSLPAPRPRVRRVSCHPA
jgi:RNA polymerase sigma-B factor